MATERVPEPVEPAPVAPTRTVPAATAVETRPAFGAGSLALRVVLTVAGAAGMLVGAFLPWANGHDGVNLSARAYVEVATGFHPTFATSAGAVMILLALLAMLGLAPRSGWLTRLAGALGVVGFVLIAIELYRGSAGLPGAIGAGLWLSLAGSVMALIGGFFGTRHRVVYAADPAAPVVRPVG